MEREPHFHRFVLTKIAPFISQFPIQYINGKRNCAIAYRHFVHLNPSKRQLIVLVNGRSENLLKWSEVAYDFYQQGFDVLQFDHRGQGYSDRLLKDQYKGYIDEFRFYVEDMDSLISYVNSKYNYKNQYVIAHSMGALISSYYLANFDHQIKSAVFSAPFFGLPTEHPLRDELIINLMMLFGQGQRYVFGKTEYKPADLKVNELSFCKTRMRWMNRINRHNPELRLGSPTFRWIHLCLIAIKQLPSILPRIEIPVLILRAEKEKIVKNENLDQLATFLPQSKVQVVPNAKHEILFERDSIRNKVLAQIISFFILSFQQDTTKE
ncbi:alpha/beta fold hydrolase [Seminibacterium arietis]|uniref:Alpha/beta fold hydrolase n=1 Tax=Seminibacterium arietis TaxID=1173502 RepID=A0ABW3I799_9PAST